MQIQPIQNNVPRAYNTQFKSVYPVIHWVAESNASYAPALTEEFSRTLNGKLVRLLNTSSGEIVSKLNNIQQQIAILSKEIETGTNEKSKKNALKKIEELEKNRNVLSFTQKIHNFVRHNDKDYADCPHVRTFYNRNGGYRANKFEPLVYLMTGKDALRFEKEYAKPIGCLNNANMKFSAELQQAKHDYWRKGFDFVNKRAQQYCDKNKMPYELHVKINTNRNDSGQIKGYNIMGMGYYPSEGSNNPFVITGLIKSGEV